MMNNDMKKSRHIYYDGSPTVRAAHFKLIIIIIKM